MAHQRFIYAEAREEARKRDLITRLQIPDGHRIEREKNHFFIFFKKEYIYSLYK